MSTVAERNKAATQFFWRLLALSTAVSIIGNVAHAVFNTGAGNTVVAAMAAVVPPVVLCAAIHGLAVMVRLQITGRYYMAALGLMLGVGMCALVLSFHALYELAVQQAGMPAFIAWLWPLAIDLSVTFSTLALLALTTGKKARQAAAVANRAPRKRVSSSRVAKPRAIKAAQVAA
jgi:hypothetical protein